MLLDLNGRREGHRPPLLPRIVFLRRGFNDPLRPAIRLCLRIATTIVSALPRSTVRGAIDRTASIATVVWVGALGALVVWAWHFMRLQLRLRHKVERR